jgi:recombination protein RecT
MSMVETHADAGQEIIAAPKQERLPVELKNREGQFQAALPAHVPVERFMRVVLTAVQNNPALARADRPSLWNSAMRAAQDGLLPDGRDGAFVIYNTKEKDEGGKERWIAKVQWMPMIGGIRKKVRNSGEIKDWNAQVVHAKDAFEFELGDQPFIRHKPFMDGDPGPVVAAYSIAQFKSGELSREVMTRAQIEKVRSASRSKDKGPWIDWFEEMARKTVARRHAKVLPMSTDLDDLIRRDDELYDLDGKSDKVVAGAAPKSLGDRLDMLAGTAPNRIEHDAETGEIIDEVRPPETAANGAPSPGPVVDSQEAVESAVLSATFPAATAPDAVKTSPKTAARVETKAPSAEDRRKVLLADLVKQGDEHAAEGGRSLEEWVDGLNGDETALISAAQIKAWRNEAARAGQ